jgi:AcrR family transcriptional regulator
MATPSVKDRLLRIATQRFASVGFEATTTRLVASRAGVALPTRYHYFGETQNLYLEAGLATFGPRSAQALAIHTNSRTVAERKVFTFFVDFAYPLLENENFFKLAHRDIIDQNGLGIRRLAKHGWDLAFNTGASHSANCWQKSRAPYRSYSRALG